MGQQGLGQAELGTPRHADGLQAAAADSRAWEVRWWQLSRYLWGSRQRWGQGFLLGRPVAPSPGPSRDGAGKEVQSEGVSSMQPLLELGLGQGPSTADEWGVAVGGGNMARTRVQLKPAPIPLLPFLQQEGPSLSRPLSGHLVHAHVCPQATERLPGENGPPGPSVGAPGS